ncbi:hypothetical protein ACQCWA_11820 [Rossellomorea aquimaris]|uniref:hypothetical protein n=1 Tax=Rossellomorea aquimaris TaxID=189382 RepID=UPI003CEC7EF7
MPTSFHALLKLQIWTNQCFSYSVCCSRIGGLSEKGKLLFNVVRVVRVIGAIPLMEPIAGNQQLNSSFFFVQ